MLIVTDKFWCKVKCILSKKTSFVRSYNKNSQCYGLNTELRPQLFT